MVGPMKRCFIAMLAAAIAVACAPEELENTEKVSEAIDDIEKIFVSIVDESTRVQLNSKVQTVWNAGDEIMTFHPGGTVGKYRFQGNTGDRSGVFKQFYSGYYQKDPGFAKHYAIYPADLMAGLGYVGSDPALLFMFSDVQYYTENSYGVGSNVMVAESDDPNDFKFRNMSSFFRFNITGTKKVAQVSLKGNDSEVLSGEFFFMLKDMLKAYWNSAYSNEIRLICNEPVQLSDTPTAFYFALLPTIFKKGITVTITFTDGTQLAKSTSKRIEMERNAVLPMATIATDMSNWQTVEIVHSANTFRLPVFGGGTSVSGYIYWGDGNQTSLSTSSGSYMYWDNQPSHTVVTKSEGATSVEFPSLKGVTEINFSNF